MASTSLNLYSTVANNTDFRAWGKFISDAMVAGGFTIVSTDIDWSTVSAPGSNNTFAGYEVFQSSDAGVGQHDYFVKFRYGRSSNANRYMFAVQVGWSHSGGTVSGNNLQTYTGNFIPGNDGDTSIAMPCYACVDSDGIQIAMFDGTISGGTHAFCFTIGRTRDKTGATQDRLDVWSMNPTGQPQISGIIPYSGTVFNFDISQTGGQQTCGWRAFYGSTQYTDGLNNGLATYAGIAGALLMESIGQFAGHSGIISAGGQLYSFNVYGVTRRYISIGTRTLTLAGSTHRVLMRYDI